MSLHPNVYPYLSAAIGSREAGPVIWIVAEDDTHYYNVGNVPGDLKDDSTKYSTFGVVTRSSLSASPGD